MSYATGPVHELVKTKDYSEGYVKVLGYWLYYRSFGDSNRKGTVLCLHGTRRISRWPFHDVPAD